MKKLRIVAMGLSLLSLCTVNSLSAYAAKQDSIRNKSMYFTCSYSLSF